MGWDIGKKIVGWMVLASVIIGVFIIGTDFLTPNRGEGGTTDIELTDEPHTNVSVDSSAHTKISGLEASVYFIGECSGMNLSQPRVHIAAVSECVGRIRGLVDGHNLSMAMVGAINATQGKALRLFCISPKFDPDELLTDTMNWVDAHQNEYARLVAAENGRDVTTIVIIKALQETYPCANT